MSTTGIHTRWIINCDWYFLASVLGNVILTVCVCVCVLTAAREGNLQLSVREVGGTIRSLCNWEHGRKCETSLRARRTLLDTFERICVRTRPVGSSSCHPFCTLVTSVLHASPFFTAVSFGLESRRWVSLNNENNQRCPIAAPLPFPLSPTSWNTGCYGFDIRDE